MITMEAGEAPEVENIPFLDIPALTASDKCDAHKSGVAQAYVRIMMKNGHYIDLCCHCANMLEFTIGAAGGVIVEDRRGDLWRKY